MTAKLKTIMNVSHKARPNHASKPVSSSNAKRNDPQVTMTLPHKVNKQPVENIGISADSAFFYLADEFSLAMLAVCIDYLHT